MSSHIPPAQAGSYDEPDTGVTSLIFKIIKQARLTSSSQMIRVRRLVMEIRRRLRLQGGIWMLCLAIY